MSDTEKKIKCEESKILGRRESTENARNVLEGVFKGEISGSSGRMK